MINMTKTETIKSIDLLSTLYAYQSEETNKKVIEKAIKAIQKIYEIESIISIDNSIIQEDVLKYKMICEVIKYEGHN